MPSISLSIGMLGNRQGSSSFSGTTFDGAEVGIISNANIGADGIHDNAAGKVQRKDNIIANL